MIRGWLPDDGRFIQRLAGRMKRVVLYGRGTDYNQNLDRIMSMERDGEIKVIGLTDSSTIHGGTCDGFSLISVDEISDLDPDIIFVMTSKYATEITKTLIGSYGIDPDKVFSFHVLNMPFITMEDYEKIRKRDWTIISNSCFGGMLYYQFALECKSPFKNMWIEGGQYLKMLEDLPGYLSKTPVFDHWEEARSIYDEPRYPVLKLGDVQLHCNHDTDPDKAIDDFVRRRRLVNLDKLMVVMTSDNAQIIEGFRNLPYEWPKICFTNLEEHLPDTIHIDAADFLELSTKANAVGLYSTGPVNTVKLMLGREDIMI